MRKSFLINQSILNYLYGISQNAVSIANDQLSEIPPERWKYYFEKWINNDKEVLSNLISTEQILRFSSLLLRIGRNDLENLPKSNQRLYNALIKGQVSMVARLSGEMYKNMKG